MQRQRLISYDQNSSQESRILAETDSQIVLLNRLEGRIVLADRSHFSSKQPALHPPKAIENGNGNSSDEDDPERLNVPATCPTCGAGRSRAYQEEPSSTLRIVDGQYFTILEDWLQNSSFNQGYYDKFFVELNKLGRGQRGAVFKVQHVLDGVDLGEYAVKAVPTGSSHSWLVKMLREVLLLGKLKHPNVIDYKHAWLEQRQLSPFVPEVPCLFILMELANGGNLDDYILISGGLHQNDDVVFEMNPYSTSVIDRKRSHSQSLSRRMFPVSLRKSGDEGNAQAEGGIGVNPKTRSTVRYLQAHQIKSIFVDILLGLQHLHKNNIVHRDLKPPNLLLSFSPGVDRNTVIPKVLISDFGECELISEEISRMRSGGTGTLEFMPPEVLERDQFGNYLPNHSITIDLWSLGVVLYFICFAEVPFSQTDDVDILREEILHFDSSKMVFPATKRVPDYFLFLIRSLLSKNITDRPSVDQILEELSREPQVSSPLSTTSTRIDFDTSKLPTESLVSKPTPRPTSAMSFEQEYNTILSVFSCLLPCIPSIFYSTPKPFLTLGLCVCSLYIFLFRPIYSQLLFPFTAMFLLFSIS